MTRKIAPDERCKDCGCILAFESCDTQYGDFSDFYCNNPKCPNLKEEEKINKLFEETFIENIKKEFDS